MELYKRVTAESEGNYFSVYCTQQSMDSCHDDIKRWVDQLAERLGWQDYTVTITPATESEATQRPHALFENRPS